MPWNEVDTMSLRREFVSLAIEPGANIRELCRRFGVSPKTGYKCINRYRLEGPEGIRDRSRRPKHTPRRTSPEMEKRVVKIRESHTAWGGRKIRDVLLRAGGREVPAASTITDILRRHGKLDPRECAKHKPFMRFEYEAPNELWQMDFKGHFQTPVGRCNPLTILDDHSRFSVGLFACEDQRWTTVQSRLTEVFRRYGLPERILTDNGSPWGSDLEHPHTKLTAWLMRLGIRVIHGRPFHPQTQGKDERFHRTLQAELLRYETFADLAHCQEAFDGWREMYNHERPHEALGMEVPASRYRISERAFPETLPAIEYGPGEIVRKVCNAGHVYYRGKSFRVGKAFDGYPVALRPAATKGRMEVYFCAWRIATIDLKENETHA